MAIALRFLSVATFLFLLISSAAASSEVHDLLEKFGLPKGLLPHLADDYSLADDGSFEVRLEHPCYVKFTDLVFYAETITGHISYGTISEIQGIQVKKLFAWLPITSIWAVDESKSIEFIVGFLSEKLPWELFENVPHCRNKGLQKASYRRNADLLSKELFGTAEIRFGCFQFKLEAIWSSYAADLPLCRPNNNLAISSE
ncbi:hypothetical protein ZIOFF_014866 [Zingiber officinale]|uniref:Uncharacterized protein n=1 Tax=Zingiber officinale TaxID=94328 RepID=A0A8J5HHV0_ZINOF|nr:hypothetical protein ZIOFF_014866 [Zingiber officinale]